jgi:hypothetical protein
MRRKRNVIGGQVIGRQVIGGQVIRGQVIGPSSAQDRSAPPRGDVIRWLQGFYFDPAPFDMPKFFATTE